MIAHGFNETAGGGIFNNGTLIVAKCAFFSNDSFIEAPLPLHGGEGGAIWNSGTLTIANTTFSSNNSSNFTDGPVGQGGAIWNIGTLTITNGTFADNYSGGGPAGGDGGAIWNDGTLTIANSTFSGNGVFEGGGAIWNDRTLSITNTTFSGNVARYAGGGIYSSGAKVTVAASTFSNNQAETGGGIGNSGTLKVTSSAFSGNGPSLGGGGGIENDRGETLGVTNSTFSDNDSGGIQNSGTLTVTNCTFFDNVDTGGIENDGTLTVTNCTFSGNSGLTGGGFAGAIYNLGLASLKSSILTGSRDESGGPANNCGGKILDRGYNISDDASCAFSATGSRNKTNPMLDPAGLQNNGGPTPTISLAPGSPAIDAIPLGACTDQQSRPINTDQRGALRPDAGELRCDIGAYELQDFAGEVNCQEKNFSALVRHYGSLVAAAAALGFPTEEALLIAILTSCAV
jgi:predicted outer membrane repeat protein